MIVIPDGIRFMQFSPFASQKSVVLFIWQSPRDVAPVATVVVPNGHWVHVDVVPFVVA